MEPTLGHDESMPDNDVAIYAPESSDWYERTGGRGGGAERQMMLLALALSSKGFRVAHIVFQPHDPMALPPRLTLVRREDDDGARSVVGGLREAMRVWRALSAADARVIIVRSATPAVGVAALHCKLHRRKLIFSSATDSDFIPPETSKHSLSSTLYRLGLSLADVVVVQSRDQVSLARHRLQAGRGDIVHVPSFCERADDEAETTPSRSFLWVGRIRAEKAPLRYVALARAIPDERFSMIPIVLDAKSEYRQLQDAADNVDNLELLERIPHPQLMERISGAIAVVNTSTDEGMPNVFLEAWARGVPVLTLECDPDRVVEQRGLGVAARGSWDRFVAGARELLDGGFPRAEFSGRARSYVEEFHSVDAVSSRWAGVLEPLVHGA
jgi:glycosyltransferase involved in cell wall biosynthesis